MCTWNHMNVLRYNHPMKVCLHRLWWKRRWACFAAWRSSMGAWEWMRNGSFGVEDAFYHSEMVPETTWFSTVNHPISIPSDLPHRRFAHHPIWPPFRPCLLRANIPPRLFGHALPQHVVGCGPPNLQPPGHSGYRVPNLRQVDVQNCRQLNWGWLLPILVIMNHIVL